MRIRLAVLGWLLASGGVVCSADGPAETGESARRVRLRLGGEPALVGTLIGSDARTVTLQLDDGRGRIDVDRARVTSVEKSIGKYPRTLEGLLCGAAAWGALVATVAAFSTLDESGLGEPLFIGGMVLAGGVIGSTQRVERWERMRVDQVEFRIRPRPRGVQVQVAVAF